MNIGDIRVQNILNDISEHYEDITYSIIRVVKEYLSIWSRMDEVHLLEEELVSWDISYLCGIKELMITVCYTFDSDEYTLELPLSYFYESSWKDIERQKVIDEKEHMNIQHEKRKARLKEERKRYYLELREEFGDL